MSRHIKRSVNCGYFTTLSEITLDPVTKIAASCVELQAKGARLHFSLGPGQSI